MVAPREQVSQALSRIGVTSWGEARATLFGGSTRRVAEAAGVTPRSVQRWIAAEEGRASQSRKPNTARLGEVSRRAALEQIRDGAPVRYSFVGNIETRAGGHRGRRGRTQTQRRDTSGRVSMDLDAARDWARAELGGDSGALDRLSEAMFGPDSDYPIPPSPGYPELRSIDVFELDIGQPD